jgi:hypothetical protein
MRPVGWVLFFAFAAASGACGVWSSLLVMEATEMVNSRLAGERQFRVLFGNFRYFDLRRNYAEFFPDGKLIRRAESTASGMLSLLVLGIAIGFYFRS